MAEFTTDEFQNFFKDIGKQFEIDNIDDFTDSVIADLSNYRDSQNKDNRSVIPENYFGKEFEYFILNHFARYYLDGLRYNLQISNTFLKSEIKGVLLEDDNKISYRLNINNKDIEQTRDDYNKLSDLFIAIGKSLVNKNFSLNDFYNFK